MNGGFLWLVFHEMVRLIVSCVRAPTLDTYSDPRERQVETGVDVETVPKADPALKRKFFLSKTAAGSRKVERKEIPQEVNKGRVEMYLLIRRVVA